MSDRYLDLVNSGVGRTLATRLGLPRPTPLRRYAAPNRCGASSPWNIAR